MRPIPQALCLGLIHQFEGEAGAFRPLPAKDCAGNWEIGWGHKLAGPAYAGAPIDAATADTLALNDLEIAAQAVCDRLSDRVMQITDKQYAALIDFTFNEGARAFAGSTLAAKVQIGSILAASQEFDRWVWAHVDGKLVQLAGLVRRRRAERALFLS